MVECLNSYHFSQEISLTKLYVFGIYFNSFMLSFNLLQLIQLKRFELGLLEVGLQSNYFRYLVLKQAKFLKNLYQMIHLNKILGKEKIKKE